MAVRLSKPKVDHLAMVMSKGGKNYAPRNPEAVVFGVKGAETDEAAQQGVLSKIVDAVKAALGWPVTSDVQDDVDGDGDGADDYNQLADILSSTYGDLQTACGIQDDDARSDAVKSVLDKHLQKIDAMRGDSTDKAGARHSAADQAKIDAAAKSMGNLKKHLDAASKAHAAASDSINGLQPAAPDDSDDDSANETKAASDDNEGKYGDVEYADTKNKKYPIDTKAHAKAAWSYINQEKNAKEYDSDELATIKARIKAACKKFGIEISDESDSKAGLAEEIDMTKDEIAALVAETTKAAFAEAKAALQPEIDAAKADAEKAKAEAAGAEAARQDALTAQKAAEAQANANARKGSGTAADTTPADTQKARSEALQRTVKAALGGSSSRPL